MVSSKSSKKFQDYSCGTCNYNTSRLSQYNRHLLTAKHKMITNDNINTTEKPPKSSKAFECDCGNKYNFASGLSRHKQKCQYNAEEPIENTFVPEKEPSDRQLLMTVIKQMAEKDKQMTELTTQITKILPKIGDTTNNTNTNCNNTFNVQLYLNNECKNAMSIQDFIKSIELNMSHLKAVTDKGYVDSVSNIMIKALGDLEITDRPLHCTDLKRDTIYIKNNDEWNKSTATDDLMNGVITNIENKQYDLVRQYARENPQAAVLDTPENIYQNKALGNALGNCIDSEVLQKKIYKEVLPTIKLNKSSV